MLSAVKMQYRVDTVPVFLRPVFYLYGYGVGLLLYAFSVFQRLTIKVQVEDGDNLAAGLNYIFCHWHESTALSLQCSVPRLPSFLGERPQVWMQHPAWYMKPIHVLLHLVGVKRIILGSSGHDGRKAANDLVGYLQSGCSTVLMPDGPNGPPKVLKKGILHIACQSQVAIVPMRVAASRFLIIRTWDRKRIPMPFSRVRICIGRPITVSEQTLKQAEQRLCEDLG